MERCLRGFPRLNGGIKKSTGVFWRKICIGRYGVKCWRIQETLSLFWGTFHPGQLTPCCPRKRLLCFIHVHCTSFASIYIYMYIFPVYEDIDTLPRMREGVSDIKVSEQRFSPSFPQEKTNLRDNSYVSLNCFRTLILLSIELFFK